MRFLFLHSALADNSFRIAAAATTSSRRDARARVCDPAKLSDVIAIAISVSCCWIVAFSDLKT